MPEFLELHTPEEALTILTASIRSNATMEWVETSLALDRVVAEPILAPYPLPAFPRSTVDGYALRAADTYGASESLPIYLRVAGEVLMGTTAELDIPPAHCALIHTGGMLPESTDAVVMLEHTQTTTPIEIEVLKAVAPGENVIRIGEDVACGEEVVPVGSRLRPAGIGGLAALGIKQVAVSCKPRVAILSSGDEVVPLEAEIIPGQVHDVNSYTLSALVERSGGQPICYGILPDKVDLLEEAARRALSECDLVVITAGSSASARDLTAQVINRLGEPGVLVHGVNVRPGKPTILGVCNGKAVIGLPGNPVSALLIAGLFIAPLIVKQLGLIQQRPKPTIQAKLSVNIASRAGREDWIPVRLRCNAEGYQAEPVFGKSNLIFTLVRADGLICIPQNATGLHAGDEVEVQFMD